MQGPFPVRRPTPRIRPSRGQPRALTESVVSTFFALLSSICTRVSDRVSRSHVDRGRAPGSRGHTGRGVARRWIQRARTAAAPTFPPGAIHRPRVTSAAQAITPGRSLRQAKLILAPLLTRRRRRGQPLRHLERRLQALERARGVEAVLDWLVVGVAKRENLAAPDRAVVTHDRSPPQPADGDEDRDGAVLEEVVVRGVEADAAQVGDEGRSVERVVGGEAGREEPPRVEPAYEAHAEPQHGRRQAQEEVDLAVGRRRAPGAALADRGVDAVDHRRERLAGVEGDLLGEDRCVALEALFGAEGEPDAAPLVEPAAGDEAVEPRELRQRQADRAQHQVKERDRPLWRPAGVQPLERLPRRLRRDLLLEEDEGAVSARHEERHDAAHGVHRRDQGRVRAGEERHDYRAAAARRRATPRASSQRSALRSASAMIVSWGFTPIDEGSTLASATTRPSVSCTAPLASVAPRCGSVAIRAVPMMWTVMSSTVSGTGGRSWIRRSWSGPSSRGRSANGSSTRRAPAAKRSSAVSATPRWTVSRSRGERSKSMYGCRSGPRTTRPSPSSSTSVAAVSMWVYCRIQAAFSSPTPGSAPASRPGGTAA